MPNTSTTTAYALLVRPDGFFQVLDWPTDSAKTLETLRTAIECNMVDVADITADLSMWIDDEGMLTESPYQNVPAFLLYAHYGAPRQAYFGNAVFTGGTDANGDTLGLTEDAVLGLLLNLLRLMHELPRIPAQRTK
ncbi:DUF3846 domain-containing protein [Streptomyces sp. NPDC050600]|uniref:DUF3846 domain-containing protein n=1 Tax=Streptomyces sp. NPDC050600 TaxID=3157213 RepID=UPI003412C439